MLLSILCNPLKHCHNQYINLLYLPLFALVCFPSANQVLARAIDHAVRFIVLALEGDIAVYLRLLLASQPPLLLASQPHLLSRVYPAVIERQGAKAEEPSEECLTRSDREGRILEYEVYHT
jgi:hypothetical protein